MERLRERLVNVRLILWFPIRISTPAFQPDFQNPEPSERTYKRMFLWICHNIPEFPAELARSCLSRLELVWSHSFILCWISGLNIMSVFKWKGHRISPENIQFQRKWRWKKCNAILTRLYCFELIDISIRVPRDDPEGWRVLLSYLNCDSKLMCAFILY